MLVEPVGEEHVQLGPRGLRQRVVSRVPDEQVPEAESVVPGKLRLVGPDELLPDERRQSAGHGRLVRREDGHGAAVEDATLDGTALQDLALGGVELVEAGGEKRLDRRRDGHV